jgi:hypothetical protein
MFTLDDHIHKLIHTNIQVQYRTPRIGWLLWLLLLDQGLNQNNSVIASTTVSPDIGTVRGWQGSGGCSSNLPLGRRSQEAGTEFRGRGGHFQLLSSFIILEDLPLFWFFQAVRKRREIQIWEEIGFEHSALVKLRQ